MSSNTSLEQNDLNHVMSKLHRNLSFKSNVPVKVTQVKVSQLQSKNLLDDLLDVCRLFNKGTLISHPSCHEIMTKIRTFFKANHLLINFLRTTKGKLPPMMIVNQSMFNELCQLDYFSDNNSDIQVIQDTLRILKAVQDVNIFKNENEYQIIQIVPTNDVQPRQFYNESYGVFIFSDKNVHVDKITFKYGLLNRHQFNAMYPVKQVNIVSSEIKNNLPALAVTKEDSNIANKNARNAYDVINGVVHPSEIGIYFEGFFKSLLDKQLSECSQQMDNLSNEIISLMQKRHKSIKATDVIVPSSAHKIDLFYKTRNNNHISFSLKCSRKNSTNAKRIGSSRFFSTEKRNFEVFLDDDKKHFTGDMQYFEHSGKLKYFVLFEYEVISISGKKVFNGDLYIYDRDTLLKFLNEKSYIKKVKTGKQSYSCDFFKADLINNHIPLLKREINIAPDEMSYLSK